MGRIFRYGAAAFALSAAASVNAATLIVDDDGQLRGASGVDVEGALYDVTFADGTCIELFSGCDEASDFNFSDLLLARAAGQALLDQVFQGLQDTRPELTFGCEFEVVCTSLIPIQGGLVFQVRNSAVEAEDRITLAPFSVPDLDFRGRTQVNYSIFTPFSAVGAVPEPGTWMLLMLGFFGAGAALRRKASIRSLSVRYT